MTFPRTREEKEPPTPTHKYVQLKKQKARVCESEQEQDSSETKQVLQEKQSGYEEELCKVSCECQGCWLG